MENKPNSPVSDDGKSLVHSNGFRWTIGKPYNYANPSDAIPQNRFTPIAFSKVQGSNSWQVVFFFPKKGTYYVQLVAIDGTATNTWVSLWPSKDISRFWSEETQQDYATMGEALAVTESSWNVVKLTGWCDKTEEELTDEEKDLVKL